MFRKHVEPTAVTWLRRGLSSAGLRFVLSRMFRLPALGGSLEEARF
jgi:hypothetical protein